MSERVGMQDRSADAFLPKFDSHEGHDKLERATEEDIRKVRVQALACAILEEIAAEKGGRHNVSVLDFGCGRGLTVAALRRMGYRAYGVDVVKSYIDNSAGLLDSGDGDFLPASLLNSNGRSIFPDDFFDVIISDQVFEHVENIEVAISEIARVTAPGGRGVHFFPPRFSPVELHVMIPFVHWAPKGRPMDRVVAAMMRLGFGSDYFKTHSLQDRIKIYSEFMQTETFYRSQREVVRTFSNHGMLARGAGREKLMARGGAVGRIAAIPMVGTLGGWLYNSAMAKAIVCQKPITERPSTAARF